MDYVTVAAINDEITHLCYQAMTAGACGLAESQ